MNVGSLFSGIGGIEIGFERQGFTTEWFVEYEPYAQAILRKHWPETPIHGDITTVNIGNLPRVDILTGGFPCQDISNAGKRVGITGSRSSLWKYYLEAIRVLRPRYAFIENVAALANRGLNVVLADLAEVGYDAEWYNISASAVGAPHRRERIFIISYPNSCRHLHREFKEQSTERGEQAQCEPIPSSKDVANSNFRGWNEGNKQQYNNNRKWEICENESNNKDEIRSIIGTSNSFNGWWAVEPCLGRVADGVSHRMDRIKCLGNAVVPSVAEVFAKAIKNYEEHKR